MSTEENKAMLRRFFDEVLNKQKLPLVDELIDTSYIYHGPFGELKGPQSYKQVSTEILTAFPDHHITIEDMVAEGDKVVSRFTARGTHKGGDYMGFAPKGKQFKMSGIMISRIAGGKIVEDWESIDLLGQLQQLGAIPPLGTGK
jgi:predicted ester cyclase